MTKDERKKDLTFANGDPMNPTFGVDGVKYYTSEDVERKIEEYEDRIRVMHGQLNIALLNSQLEEREHKRAMSRQLKKRCITQAAFCLVVGSRGGDNKKVEWLKKWYGKFSELAEHYKNEEAK